MGLEARAEGGRGPAAPAPLRPIHVGGSGGRMEGAREGEGTGEGRSVMAWCACLNWGRKGGRGGLGDVEVWATRDLGEAPTVLPGLVGEEPAGGGGEGDREVPRMGVTSASAGDDAAPCDLSAATTPATAPEAPKGEREPGNSDPLLPPVPLLPATPRVGLLDGVMGEAEEERSSCLTSRWSRPAGPAWGVGWWRSWAGEWALPSLSQAPANTACRREWLRWTGEGEAKELAVRAVAYVVEDVGSSVSELAAEAYWEGVRVTLMRDSPAPSVPLLTRLSSPDTTSLPEPMPMPDPEGWSSPQ